MEQKRKHNRYETEIPLQFHLKFAFATKIRFFFKEDVEKNETPEEYWAISKNVSTVGLCFSSERYCNPGEVLILEVFIADRKVPIYMEGLVIWSKDISDEKDESEQYATGLKIELVNGENNKESISYDETFELEWSILLESLLGDYHKIAQEKNSDG